MAARPRYDELPRNEVVGNGAAWGVFGDDDDLGTINLLTKDVVLRAADEIRRGTVFPLSLPLNVPNPSLAPREPYVHRIFNHDRNSQDDALDNFSPQGSTQWDGLRHVRAREFGFYNGVSAEDAGPSGTRLGIEKWAEHGIVGRGALVDVAAHFERAGKLLDPREEFPISPELLEAIAAEQNLELRHGDILLVRTGFVAAYKVAGQAEREEFRARQHCPGLAADEGMARFLWDRGFAAVAADNHAVECQPGDPAVGFLHRRLIPMLGFALGEWFDLDALAADCEADGRYSCFLASVPLNLPGGVGSPANALAIK
jgi:kynurenine formamidase